MENDLSFLSSASRIASDTYDQGREKKRSLQKQRRRRRKKEVKKETASVLFLCLLLSLAAWDVSRISESEQSEASKEGRGRCRVERAEETEKKEKKTQGTDDRSHPRRGEKIVQMSRHLPCKSVDACPVSHREASLIAGDLTTRAKKDRERDTRRGREISADT